jgi:hypothetical protein
LCAGQLDCVRALFSSTRATRLVPGIAATPQASRASLAGTCLGRPWLI